MLAGVGTGARLHPWRGTPGGTLTTSHGGPVRWPTWAATAGPYGIRLGPRTR